MNSTTPLPPEAENVLRKPGTRTTAMFFMFIGVLPFLVEMVPWNRPVPLSAHLLPEYSILFAAVYLCGLLPGLVIGLALPLMRVLSASFVDRTYLVDTGVELLVFGLLAQLLMSRAPRASWVAPVALLIGKAVAVVAHLTIPAMSALSDPLGALLNGVVVVIPAFFFLGFVNFSLIRLCPPPDDWDAY